MTDERVYNPLDRATYQAMVYNAIGRASEIGTHAAYRLTHSTGNSGWSVGAMQWDFGQPGRGDKADVLLAGYQAWAAPEERFQDSELASLSRRLQTRGQVGNQLSAQEQSRLGAYLRSDDGREFVDGLNREQIDRKWTNVGEPLSRIEWLQRLAGRDPAEAAEIVAMASKLYNQNENRGGRLLRHLQDTELTSAETRTWIGIQGIEGLRPEAQAAIVSGRDNALAGIQLVSALEESEGRLGQAWRQTVHGDGNPALSRGFNTDPDIQLLDGMMRAPASGARILAHVDNGAPAQAVSISGFNEAARLEVSHIVQGRDGALTVHSPTGDAYEMTPEGWNRNGVPMQGTLPREVDRPDHTEPGRVPFMPVPRRALPGLGSREPDASFDQGTVGPASYSHPLLEQSRAAVERLDREFGRVSDNASACMGASLACLAREKGLGRIDHVVLSRDSDGVRQGENVFVVQGRLDDPTHLVAHMRTDVAVRTPIAESVQRLEQLDHSVPQQSAQLAMQEQQSAHLESDRRPMMM